VPSSARHVRARVEFDELAWSEDIAAASPSAGVVARQQRDRLERDGQIVADIRACEAEGPDGTSLRGCVKAYLPPPDGPWGVVFRFAKRPDGAPYLLVIAFGLRHPPAKSRQPSVYQRAHRRLHEG
jgi:hypothetical protein